MLQRNARNSLINAATSSVAVNLATQYVAIWAVKLGADNLQLGYLSSWPQAVSVVSVLVVAGAVARVENKQRWTAGIFLLGRAASLLLAATPWLQEQWRVWWLIFSWVLAVFPNAAATNLLQSFLADVFPGSERARAFASRNVWASAAGTATLLLSGWLLDYVLPDPLGYQLMFAGSFLVGLAEIYAFMRLREPEKPAGEAESAGRRERVGFSTYMETLRHKPFLQFLLVSVPFHFTWQMAWPIFTRFQVTDLGANNTWISYLTVANSIAAIVTYPWWARWAERFGNRKAVGLAALQIATAPALVALAANLKILLVINLWTGAGVAGFSLLVLNSLLEVSPSQGRPVYLAVHAALVSVSASIAPMVGAWLMDVLPTRTALGLCTIPRLLAGLGFFLMFYLVERRKGNGGGSAKSTSPNAAVQ